MYNFSSPIVQNMMGNNYQYMNQYYNNSFGPIGSIPVGYNGYNNGGYYNGNYQFYNPYLAMQQQKQREAIERENIRRTCELNKKIYIASCNASGVKPDEEYMKYKFEPQFDNPDYQKEKEYNDLVDLSIRIDNGTAYMNQTPYRIQAYKEQQSAIYKQTHPDDMSLFEYLQVLPNETFDLEIELLKQKQRGMIGNSYDKDEFNKLLNMHNNSSNYFETMYKDVSISDKEITFPDTPYKQKRDAFMKAIMNNG